MLLTDSMTEQEIIKTMGKNPLEIFMGLYRIGCTDLSLYNSLLHKMGYHVILFSQDELKNTYEILYEKIKTKTIKEMIE